MYGWSSRIHKGSTWQPIGPKWAKTLGPLTDHTQLCSTSGSSRLPGWNFEVFVLFLKHFLSSFWWCGGKYVPNNSLIKKRQIQSKQDYQTRSVEIQPGNPQDPHQPKHYYHQQCSNVNTMQLLELELWALCRVPRVVPGQFLWCGRNCAITFKWRK